MLALRVLGLVLVFVLVSGCVGVPAAIRGSGRAVTEEYDFDGFTRVTVGSAFQVEITQSENYSVSVTVDDNLKEYLEVTTSGDTLRIRLLPRVRLSFQNPTLKAQITMPTLEGLDLSGATRATVSGFDSEGSLDVEVSGASTLTGDINTGDATFGVSGASTVRLDGQAANLDIEASGASTVDLEDLAAADARAEASGASRIVVNVSGSLDAGASGASSVRYVGEPTSVNSDTSGASSVGRK